MSNQEFVYFNWGTHDNPSNPYYGLTSPTADIIYAVGEDYQQLKLIQLIMIATKQTATINLSAIVNYAPGLLDNEVCLNWAVKSPVGQQSVIGLASDFRTRCNDTLVETTNSNINNIELQKNIMFLQKILNDVDYFFKSEINAQTDNKHIKVLKEFIEVLLPDDTSIQELISVEQDLLEQNKLTITNIKNEFLRALAQLDYSQPHNTVHQELGTFIHSLAPTNDVSVRFIDSIRAKYYEH